MVTTVTVTKLKTDHMTTEEIKKIVDDERAEQLTVQLCRHRDVATQRLECLAQEVADNMDTCTEAEIYAALMRMQKAVMALMELNKIPTAFLFSEYFERIAKTVSNTSIRQSVITLVQRLLEGASSDKQAASFFDLVNQTIAQHVTLPKEQQEAIRQQFSPMQYFFGVCAKYLDSNELMMMAQAIQEINNESDEVDQEEIISHIQNMRQTIEALDRQMSEGLQKLLIGVLLLMLLPGMLVNMLQQCRTNSPAMAQVFNKVLMRVRESSEWWDYWKDRRERRPFVEGDHDGRAHQGARRAGAGARRPVCQVDD